MELTIDRRELARALGPVSRVAGRKSPMPVLESLRLSASSSTLGITATTLQQSARAHAPAAIKGAGEVLVPAQGLADAVARMPDGELRLAVEGGHSLELRGGRARVRLPMGDVSDFPKVNLAEGPWTTLPGPALRDALAVAYAASSDESRLHLCGVSLSLEGRVLRGVATDAYRFARHEVRLDADPGVTWSILVPSPAVRQIERIAGDADSVEVHVGRLLDVRAGAVQFSTVLSDQVFPPWRQIVPSTWETRARAPRDAVLGVIERAALAVGAKDPALCFELKSGVLSVKSQSPERGESADEIDVDQEGPDVTWFVSPQIIADVVKGHVSDEVEICMGDPLDPIVVREATDARLTLAMPMRLGR